MANQESNNTNSKFNLNTIVIGVVCVLLGGGGHATIFQKGDPGMKSADVIELKVNQKNIMEVLKEIKESNKSAVNVITITLQSNKAEINQLKIKQKELEYVCSKGK